MRPIATTLILACSLYGSTALAVGPVGPAPKVAPAPLERLQKAANAVAGDQHLKLPETVGYGGIKANKAIGRETTTDGAGNKVRTAWLGFGDPDLGRKYGIKATLTRGPTKKGVEVHWVRPGLVGHERAIAHERTKEVDSDGNHVETTTTRREDLTFNYNGTTIIKKQTTAPNGEKTKIRVQDHITGANDFEGGDAVTTVRASSEGRNAEGKATRATYEGRMVSEKDRPPVMRAIVKLLRNVPKEKAKGTVTVDGKSTKYAAEAPSDDLERR